MEKTLRKAAAATWRLMDEETKQFLMWAGAVCALYSELADLWFEPVFGEDFEVSELEGIPYARF